MRVLFADRSAGLGGGASMLRTVVAQLPARGHHCEAMLRGGPGMALLRPLVSRTWWLPPVGPWAAARARHIIEHRAIDVVNTYSTRTAQQLLPACVATRTPLVMTVLNATSLDRCHEAVAYAASIIVLNRTTRDFLARQRPDAAHKIVLLDKPIDRTVFRPAARPQDGLFRVLYLGRLSTTKGQRALTVADACASLAATVPGLELEIVGTGSLLPRVRRRAGQLNAQARRPLVRVTGATLRPHTHLQRAHLLLGAGFSAAEGLACGCDVIGLGFVGLFGRVTRDNIAEALDHNFGDTDAPWHDPDPALVAAQIQEAYRRRDEDGSWAQRVVDERLAAPVAVGRIEEVLSRAACGPEQPGPSEPFDPVPRGLAQP